MSGGADEVVLLFMDVIDCCCSLTSDGQDSFSLPISIFFFVFNAIFVS